LILHAQPTGGVGITRFAVRDGQRLSYESSGAIDAMSIVALHDLLGDRTQLTPLRDRLLAAGWRVTLPDARGHGASPTISGRIYPPAQLAADTLAVLDAEGLSSFHVVAIGWSAATALTLATIAPRRVSSLVLVAPYLPTLVTDHPDAEVSEAGAAHVSALQEAATAATKGLTDRALDLVLDTRLGSGWRSRLSRPRLGAIRRAAANLGPLLAGFDAAAPEQDALHRVSASTTLLTPADAPPVERGTTATLARLLPMAHVDAVPADQTAEGPLPPALMDAVARALADGGR
jgi:pimeloyl-ACP methyl ester carboxylesterase